VKDIAAVGSERGTNEGPIMSAHAKFDFIWFSGSHQLAPLPHQ
jgi:hypothetical protein